MTSFNRSSSKTWNYRLYPTRRRKRPIRQRPRHKHNRLNQITYRNYINNEDKIINDLNKIQGNSNSIGGYYQPNDSLADTAMRPNATLNSILDSI